MATEVILPALGMAQDTGKIVRWLKAAGEQVVKGEPLLEIETDKAMVEIEAPVSGILAPGMAAIDVDIPVGRVIASILLPGEAALAQPAAAEKHAPALLPADTGSVAASVSARANGTRPPVQTERVQTVAATALASRMAEEHHLDLRLVQSAGKRVQKADVLAYLQSQTQPVPDGPVPASPKARRLAREEGLVLATIKGSGPSGAVLAADVLASATPVVAEVTETPEQPLIEPISTIWRIMAERTTQSWTATPHFYLVREVNVSRLSAWRKHLLQNASEKVTYTDLLVKIAATALHAHPRLNYAWSEGQIVQRQEANVGIAVALEDGLVVPVIQRADQLGLQAIARLRRELVAKAQTGKLRPQDLSHGTFTISNLGMYGVDAFNAIINQPQAAILAVGRIADRVVPLNGLPAIQPMMVLTLSCDHRVIDGARGAQFLETLAGLIEEPLGLLNGM